jgi:hypothetical protein
MCKYFWNSSSDIAVITWDIRWRTSSDSPKCISFSIIFVVRHIETPHGPRLRKQGVCSIRRIHFGVRNCVTNNAISQCFGYTISFHLVTRTLNQPQFFYHSVTVWSIRTSSRILSTFSTVFAVCLPERQLSWTSLFLSENCFCYSKTRPLYNVVPKLSMALFFNFSIHFGLIRC